MKRIYCNVHALNLVMSDSAKLSVVSVTFFGIGNRLYAFFFASTFRWKKLFDNVSVSLKGQCYARWESQFNVVKPLRFHLKTSEMLLTNFRKKSLEKRR